MQRARCVRSMVLTQPHHPAEPPTRQSWRLRNRIRGSQRRGGQSFTRQVFECFPLDASAQPQRTDRTRCLRQLGKNYRGRHTGN